MVDSDDWVDVDVYLDIIKTLKELVAGPQTVDMFISNFVYDKAGAKHKKVMRYKAFPENEVFQWDHAKKLHIGRYILMHSVIYRTMLLRECNLELPKHTFYVDNLFVFQPLPYVKNLYYKNVNFYHYFIGRDDQSVNEKVMISRIDQQIRVNKIMIDTMADNKIADKRIRQYMTSYLDIITTVTSVMLIRSGTEENLEKEKRTVAVFKSKRRRSVFPPASRSVWTYDEFAGQRRKKNFRLQPIRSHRNFMDSTDTKAAEIGRCNSVRFMVEFSQLKKWIF